MGVAARPDLVRQSDRTRRGDTKHDVAVRPHRRVVMMGLRRAAAGGTRPGDAPAAEKTAERSDNRPAHETTSIRRQPGRHPNRSCRDIQDTPPMVPGCAFAPADQVHPAMAARGARPAMTLDAFRRTDASTRAV